MGDQVPSSAGGEVTVSTVVHCEAVAQVVLAAHNKAVGGEKLGQMLVPPDMFCHPMDNLNYSDRAALGEPLLGSV